MDNFLTGIVVGVLLGGLFMTAMHLSVLDVWRSNAIEANCAVYNSETGEFEWVK